jgi:hypothetical protein
MKLLQQIVRNRQCGLHWNEALRAALLDREISKCTRRKQ